MAWGPRRPWGGAEEGGGPQPETPVCSRCISVSELSPRELGARGRALHVGELSSSGSCSQGGLCGAPTQVTTSHTQKPRAAQVGHGSGGQWVTWLYQGLAGLPAIQAKPISSSPEGTTWAGAQGGRARGWVPGLPWRQATQRPAWCPTGGQSCVYPEGSHPVTPSLEPRQHPRGLQKAPPLGEGQGCAGRWPAGHWTRKRRGRGAGMSGDLPEGTRGQACERRSGQGCPAGAEVCGCLDRGHLGLGSGWLVIARLLSRPCQPVRPWGPSGCSPAPSGANRLCREGKGAFGVPGCMGPSQYAPV